MEGFGEVGVLEDWFIGEERFACIETVLVIWVKQIDFGAFLKAFGHTFCDLSSLE